MRILMVLEKEYPPDNRVKKEAHALMEDGHHVAIACPTRKNQALRATIEHILVIRKPISNFYYKKVSVGALKFPFYFNYWRKFLIEILMELNYDAIHIHDLPLGRVGYEMAQRFNLKWILDLHENWPAHLRHARHTNTFMGKILSSNRQWMNYEKELTQKADAIIAVVDEMKTRLIEYGTNPDKILVVQNFFDLNQHKSMKLNPGKKNKEGFVLLYSGGVTIDRGLQIVLKGLAKALEARSDLRLWIIGDGSYLNDLKKMVNTLKINNHVSFLGSKPYKEYLEYMKKADIGLIPHFKTEQTDNSSPNKLFEYMYMGLSILASDCNSIKRMIQAARCGQTYRHDSPSDFAKFLLEMTQSSANLREMAQNGREAVFQKYNWENAKIQLQKLYQFI